MRDWLPWLLALAAAALGVAGLVRRPRRPDTRRPDTRRPDTRRPAGRGGSRPDGRRPHATAGAHPQPRILPGPGEIWWAEVRYDDGTGAKVRPCLVLRSTRTEAEVLKITSRDKSGRSDYIQIPTRPWDPQAEHDSYLDLSGSVSVPTGAFANQAGVCDPELWRWLNGMRHLRPSA